MVTVSTPDELSHRAIIDRAGGPAKVGHAIGVPPNLTKKWKSADSIPPAYWTDLVDKALATLDELATAAASRRTRETATA